MSNINNQKVVKNIIKKIMGSRLKGPITHNASLRDDLGLDSLDKVEIILSMEEKFPIHIEDATIDKIIHVKDLYSFV